MAVTYSDDWDRGDYRANDQTRNRMGFGGAENGGQVYSQRARDMGQAAQGRGAYVSDMTQSNEMRGLGLDARNYQGDALDMMHEAAVGAVPSQAELLARRNAQAAIHNATSMAGSVKGGPGARVAAMRNAQRIGAQQMAEGAQRAEEMRAAEMANARSGYVNAANSMRQGDVAMRGQDLGAAQIQQANELDQRRRNDEMQRFFESQGYNIQAGDQANQLAQQGLANSAWGQGRSATMADEGFGFNKGVTYAQVGAGAATGGVSGAMMASGGGGRSPDDITGSDERMKNVYVPSVMLSPREAKQIVPFESASGYVPMSGPADASFDQLAPSGGLDVMGSLRAHSNFATRFQRDPSGGMMMSSEEAKVPVYGAYDDAAAAVQSRRDAGGYASPDMSPMPAQSFDSAMQASFAGADPYASRASSAQQADRAAAGTAPRGGVGTVGSAILGALGGLGGRRTMLSDDKTKLAAAWDQGHAAALSDVKKVAQMPPEQMKSLGDKPVVAAVRNVKADAWDEGHTAPRPAPPAPPPAPPQMNRVQEVVAKYGDPMLSVLAGPFAPAATDKLADVTTSDEQTKNVIDLDAGSDRSTMRDGSSDPRVNSFDKNFHRDTRAEQVAKGRAYKRATEDKASKDADQMLASFGRALEQGPRAKRDEGYVPDAAMFAAMKSMKPQVYAYKPEFTPPEQQTGELQAGPMANNMVRSPVAAMTLVRDPQSGLLGIDKDKALKLTMGGLATLAEDVEELKRKKGGRK